MVLTPAGEVLYAKMVPIKDDDEEEKNILLGWSDANDNYAVDLLRKYLAKKG